jgi:hypothetical protein
MKKIKLFNIGLFLAILLIGGCGEMIVSNLPKGYFVRHESNDLQDILCKRPEGGEIPANIIDYNYNSDFIIAKQMPKIPPDPLYEKEYVYPPDKELYWIIVISNDSVYGPLGIKEFKEIKEHLNVPDKLKFK